MAETEQDEAFFNIGYLEPVKKFRDFSYPTDLDNISELLINTKQQVKTIQPTKIIKQLPAKRYHCGKLLSTDHQNTVKRVPGERDELLAGWRKVFPVLTELMSYIPLDFSTTYELPKMAFAECNREKKLKRGTAEDTIDAHTLDVYSDGVNTCTIVTTESGHLYVPLNDLRTSLMPMGTTRCQHLLTNRSIGHLLIGNCKKINKGDSVPETYQHTTSRTPLLSLSLLLYLASPCASNCTASGNKKCEVPWCWTLRSTIDPRIFVSVFELLMSYNIFRQNNFKRQKN